MDHDDEEPIPPDTEEPSYEIGYGRPPRHSQFRPGRSGNPAGRRRGSQDHATIVRRVALRRLTGEKRSIDLVLDSVRRAAATGHFIALQLVKKYTGLVESDEPPIAKGVLIVGEKLTLEEWEAKYGHLGEPADGQTDEAPPDKDDGAPPRTQSTS